MGADHEPGTRGKRARTRATLIETALVVADEKGFSAASLDEIAARVGMSKGAIYSNFESKADLMFHAAMSRSLRPAPAFIPGAPLRAQFRQLAVSIWELLPRAKGQSRAAADFQIYALSEPAITQRMAKVHKKLFDAFEAALVTRYGDELCIPARSLVVAAQALSVGFAHQFLATPKEVTRDVIFAAFDALALFATKGDAASA